MAELKKLEAIDDVNLLEQGLVSVWYDNTGHLCEAIWVRGLTYFTDCEHDDVLAMVDLKENLCGFMIHGIQWISDGVDDYVTVNLKSDLPRNTVADYHNAIERGIIKIRFDREAHYCEVTWTDDALSFAPSENEFILALVNRDGILGGFRVINTHRLAENPEGRVIAELKTRVAVTAG